VCEDATEEDMLREAGDGAGHRIKEGIGGAGILKEYDRW